LFPGGGEAARLAHHEDLDRSSSGHDVVIDGWPELHIAEELRNESTAAQRGPDYCDFLELDWARQGAAPS